MFRLLRLTSRLLLLIVVAVLAGAAACVVSAGRLLVDPAALEAAAPADAIFVLAGGDAERWLEGYELWREKRAPLIVLSPGSRDAAGVALERRGIRLPTAADVTRDVLVGQLDVPPGAVMILPVRVDNTAAEAEAMRRLAAEHGWRRILVVTSLPHTRRTRYAMQRTLETDGLHVQVRGSRYDDFQTVQWWRDRDSMRWVLTELPKLAAYRLGLGE